MEDINSLIKETNNEIQTCKQDINKKLNSEKKKYDNKLLSIIEKK